MEVFFERRVGPVVVGGGSQIILCISCLELSVLFVDSARSELGLPLKKKTSVNTNQYGSAR